MRGLLLVSLIVNLILTLLGISAAMAAPIGVLADATITVPPNPNKDVLIIPPRGATFSETFTFLATGGMGIGHLGVYATVYGTAGNVRIDEFTSSASFAATSALGSIGVSTLPAFLGSSPRSCIPLGSSCTIPFVFGLPFDVLFTAHASASYSYSGIAQIFGTRPSLIGGGVILASVYVGPLIVLDSSFIVIPDATLTVVTPEPKSTMTLGLCFFLMGWAVQRWRAVRIP